MNKYFYRLWLPLSLVFHALLIAILPFVPMAVTPAEGEVIYVQIVHDPPPPLPEPRDTPPKAIPPQPSPRTILASMPGVPKPKQRGGAGQSEIRNDTPGPGDKPTAPPAIMHAAAGTWEAPMGRVGGIGTQGTDLGPSGPSYGAGTQGGPNPGYPKLAEEAGLEGAVTVTVTVASDGSIGGVSVRQSSGHGVLDEAAVRAARRWSFGPGMQNGVQISGAVSLRFTFANGTVEGKAL
jgi:protein TonB